MHKETRLLLIAISLFVLCLTTGVLVYEKLLRGVDNKNVLVPCLAIIIMFSFATFALLAVTAIGYMNSYFASETDGDEFEETEDSWRDEL